MKEKDVNKVEKKLTNADVMDAEFENWWNIWGDWFKARDYTNKQVAYTAWINAKGKK